MQLHTVNRYFMGDTPEIGAVLCLLSKKLDIGTYFDKFRGKINRYLERRFDNEKYVMCAVTDMEDTMKTFEEKNMTEGLYE